MSTEIVLQSISTIALLISVFLIYITIKSNSKINQRILFSNITKEERELRIKLQDYSSKIDDKNLSNLTSPVNSK